MNPFLPSFLFKVMSKAFFVLFIMWVYKHNLGFSVASALCYIVTRFLSGYYRWIAQKRLQAFFKKYVQSK